MMVYKKRMRDSANDEFEVYAYGGDVYLDGEVADLNLTPDMALKLAGYLVKAARAAVREITDHYASR